MKGVCSLCGCHPRSAVHLNDCPPPPRPTYNLERTGPPVPNTKATIDVSKLPLSERVWYRNKRLYPHLFPMGV